LTTAWFDEQSRMSADELQTATFPLSRMGRRGYDEDSVQEFLRVVHDEYVRLLNERTSLWQEVQRLRRRIISGKANGHSNGALFGAADGHAHAVRLLSTAQLAADRYVADAQAYSGLLTEEARLRRDETLQEAQRYSEIILEEAHAKAREAAVSALNSAPSPLTYEEEQAAHAELAYLRTYSDVYRTHLRAYTEGILRAIEEWERSQSNLLEAASQATP
jgi:DivIVA domain-containing protein